jgi:hypothetical protein
MNAKLPLKGDFSSQKTSSKTASLGNDVNVVNVVMQAFPEPRASELRALECRGTFEAHMTVDAASQERRDTFRALCEQIGVKCVLIELAAGRSPSQPMTAKYHRGDLTTVLAEVQGHYEKLIQAGFGVVRVKLEAVANNKGVPLSDEEAAAKAFEGAYFEFHAKLRLDKEGSLDSLRALCAEHGAHLSHNDRKVDSEKATRDRFVTLRVRRCGRDRAYTIFETLLTALKDNGYNIVGTKRELTLYDSHARLDAGWLEPESRAPSLRSTTNVRH